jgi:dTDP-4-amino-4,6-dideoxygalactose transaminase
MLAARVAQRLEEHTGLPVELMSSGSAALECALRVLEAPPGARVLVPSVGCDAIAMSVLNAGATPSFYEIDTELRMHLGPDARDAFAVVVNYPFGYVPDGGEPARLEPLRRAGVRVVADCAQAFGTRVDDRPVGSLADVAVYSFADGKHLSCGEGGALAAADPALRERAWSFAHAARVRGSFDRAACGRNFAMARPVMAELNRCLDRWPRDAARRLERAQLARARLRGAPVRIVEPANDAVVVPLKQVMRLEEPTPAHRAALARVAAEFRFVQSWWPRVPMEKSYLGGRHLPFASISTWRESAFTLSLSPAVPRDEFRRGLAALSSALSGTAS